MIVVLDKRELITYKFNQQSFSNDKTINIQSVNAETFRIITFAVFISMFQ